MPAMQSDPPKVIPSSMAGTWREIAPTVSDSIGVAGLEALCSQVMLARSARERIEEEGMIVADPKGNPAPHPAIAIERAAQSEIRNWRRTFAMR